ncbi:multidrug ABC transporter permease [Kurthia zopfii]|uniref:ATP-binding cassette subfamily B protein n=1 Tax=Kurthia zopfii TaxID=1650 RepID=A0A8B4QD82_9BACL|nr:ABC transporter ATP-binding protein [Kurthia zopfii]PWI23838.1 ABC transporter ATP-binding protein [Kurthia zopfii]TDR43413.1 ATP-binding cassette subfamily B protein [Kurthia zopfii]GEK31565.1 multidrug ABC transporter permease [Kurthia zopfii]STX10667.1 Probable multidrug resistance ABC transporter ATP-binding/permease protein YheH [Kurthia zopfii]
MSVGKKLWQYALQFKKPMIIGLILLAISVGADLAGPLIIKYILDHYVATMQNNELQVKPLYLMLGVYLLSTVVYAIFRYYQYYMLQLGSNRIVQKMRKDVYGHLQKLSINYFDRLPAGKVVSRITNDTEAIRELFVTVVANFASSFMTLVGIFIIMFALDWRMGAFALIIIPILIVWSIVYRKYASKYNHVIRSKLSDLNGMLNESINGMTIIQAYGQEKHMNKEFQDINNEHFKYNNKLLFLDSATSHNLVGVVRMLIFIVFIWYFGSQEISGELAVSVGVLYAFVEYITRTMNPIMQIVDQFSRLERANVAAERVFELMEVEGEDVVKEEIPRYEGHVQFEDVWFAYNEDEYVLKNINIEAKPGETVALVGHTGSGKSSIMNLLFRYYDVSKGEIKIDGMNIQSESRQTIRQHMGIVLQDPYLFTGTIESNVSLNHPDISRKDVENALAAVGGERVLKNLAKGLDEPVLERGSTLSAGQRQLISFARALAFDPAILILDEATSNIDSETEEIIQHAMDVLKQGRTTFIIAHRLSTIKNADKILVLDAGEIVEQGSHDELLALGGRYNQMYKLQSGIKS